MERLSYTRDLQEPSADLVPTINSLNGSATEKSPDEFALEPTPKPQPLPSPSQTPLLESKPFLTFSPQRLLVTAFPAFAILVLSITFIAYLRGHGAVPADARLSRWALDHPSQTTQIAAILASALTATIRWSLGTSALHLAQKRFASGPHEVFEMELFTALKNISVVWEYKHRKKMLLMSWFVVAACGFLTSGFVALITPFPITQTSVMQDVMELDLSGVNDTCYPWFLRTYDMLWPPVPNGPPGARLCNNIDLDGFALSTCLVTQHLPQTLNAASATILEHFSSTHLPREQINLVASYPTLNNTRILGGTAGVLPAGPAGIQLPWSISQTSMTEGSNYTINQQGVWLQSFCSYEQDSQLTTTLEPGTGTVDPIILFTCPGSTASTPYLLDSEDQNGMVIAHPCLLNDKISVFWRSFNPRGNSTRNSMDFVRCDLLSQIGQVDAVLHTGLSAFKMRKAENATIPITLLSQDIVTTAMRETVRAVSLSNTPGGNLLSHVIRVLGQTYAHILPKDWDRPIDIAPTLLGLALQGIFEFQVSEIRLMFTIFARTVSRAPAECYTPIKGTRIERHAGWDYREGTAIGLIPLIITSIITFVITFMSFRIPTDLTKFDPTSPASVLAATSEGDVKLSHEGRTEAIVGDPSDVHVGRAKVQYECSDDKPCGLRLIKSANVHIDSAVMDQELIKKV